LTYIFIDIQSAIGKVLSGLFGNVLTGAVVSGTNAGLSSEPEAPSDRPATWKSIYAKKISKAYESTGKVPWPLRE
jgi:hypothetical protein